MKSETVMYLECVEIAVHMSNLTTGMKRLLSTRIRTGNSKEYSFAFSGCGWLTPFHLGAIDVFASRGMLTSASVAAGTSGGSLAALVACSGVHPKDAMEQVVKLSRDKEFFQDIDKGLKGRYLLEMMPGDIVERCNGRLHVVVTRVWPNPTTEPLIVDSFHSVDDILSCVAASSFIPMYCARRLTTQCRGYICVDGGLLSVMPPIGTVRVSPLPPIVFPKRLRPQVYPRKRLSLNTLIKQAFIPGAPGELYALHECGREAALHWCDMEEQQDQHQ